MLKLHWFKNRYRHWSKMAEVSPRGELFYSPNDTIKLNRHAHTHTNTLPLWSQWPIKAVTRLCQYTYQMYISKHTSPQIYSFWHSDRAGIYRYKMTIISKRDGSIFKKKKRQFCQKLVHFNPHECISLFCETQMDIFIAEHL